MAKLNQPKLIEICLITIKTSSPNSLKNNILKKRQALTYKNHNKTNHQYYSLYHALFETATIKPRNLNRRTSRASKSLSQSTT